MNESLNSLELEQLDTINMIQSTNSKIISEVDTFIFGLSTDELRIIVAVLIPLLVLLISNIIVLWKIRLDSNEAVRKELTILAIKNIKDRLEKFYDPFMALIEINTNIFNSFGYKSYPEEDIRRSEAAQLWDKMAQTIIIPNNDEMIGIVKSNSHLIHKEDNGSLYMQFITHAESYKHFIEFPNEVHNAFKYPMGIEDNVQRFRSILKKELEQIESGIENRIKKIKK